jgi:DNA invertase Pin-like site-specific DNA recombinase
MQHMEEGPVRCVLYLRVSLDATGEQLAVSRQRDACLKIAAARGWQVTREYVDNSVSAYDRRKKRPAYDRMVSDYMQGGFDALLCWDLDRLTRQPAQLENWIEQAEDKGLLLVTANGEADLSTYNGQLFARIKAGVARMESQHKAARQRLALKQRAERGLPPLGVRLTGYTTTGEIIWHEAAAVRQMFTRFHQGDSLRAIITWLEAEGVPSRSGRPWNPSAVRNILANPRYAGRSVYQRKKRKHARADDGIRGQWPPLVDDWLFDLVQDRLEDPRRRSHLGTDRKHLGAGLFLCGICGSTVRSHSTPAGQLTRHRYRCPRGCLTRGGEPIDELVTYAITDAFADASWAGLFTPETQRARDLTAEIGRLRDRLRQAADDYDSDLIDGARYKAKKDRLTAALDEAEAERSRAAGVPGVTTLAAAGPGDVRATWDGLTLGAQRAVISTLMTVRIYPAPRGRKGFDPATVQVEWRRGPE